MPETKLPLIGRDRVLANKLAEELQRGTKHYTRGPYERPRGATFDVQLMDDGEVPTGHIFKVTVKLSEVQDGD